jgi:nucleotide-binding universal stress UspA family protein
MYQRLLVPVDGSTASDCGLAEAIKLGQATGARLRLIHAVDTFLYGTGLDVSADAGAELFEPLRQAGAEILRVGTRAAAKAGVPVEAQLFDDLKGDLAELVTNDAERWQADLIVLGTHGRGGLRRLALGSDAEQIVRCAPIPVLLVRGPDKGAGSRPAREVDARLRRYVLAD